MRNRMVCLVIMLALVALVIAPATASAVTRSKSGNGCYASVTYTPGSGYSGSDYIYSMYGSQSGATLYRKIRCRVSTSQGSVRYDWTTPTMVGSYKSQTFPTRAYVANTWSAETLYFYRGTGGTTSLFQTFGWSQMQLP